MAGFNAEQWPAWDAAQQTGEGTALLRDLHSVALSDMGQLEGRDTLAGKIER